MWYRDDVIIELKNIIKFDKRRDITNLLFYL